MDEEQIVVLVSAGVVLVAGIVSMVWIKRRRSRGSTDAFGRDVRVGEETRWSRTYVNGSGQVVFQESKLNDSTASITLKELEAEWPSWDEAERSDFCNQLGLANRRIVPEFGEMLRFIMENGSIEQQSSCAQAIGRRLPPEESVPFLAWALEECPLGDASNFLEALCQTRAPQAIPLLRERLRVLWNDDHMWEAPGSGNEIGHESVLVIEHLIKMGEPSTDYAGHYDELVKHPDLLTREVAKIQLARYFDPEAE
jgi:hypothetical protein